MKQYLIFIVAYTFFAAGCNDQRTEKAEQMNTEKEKIIREYFSGWEKKNWELIEKNLDSNFTFTSPNGDDHLPVQKFKDKCWIQANHIQKFNFTRFANSETGAYVTYELFTKDSTSFRNTEYFDFANGKIKSIEVFFGAGKGSQGFPSNKK